MNIFRLKGKIFHFINFVFYLVIFIFGYLCGSSKINISKFFQIDNVFAVSPYYSGYENYMLNTTNWYNQESEQEYNNNKFGFDNPIPYNSYISSYNLMNSHHVFNYLEQVTRFYTDNWSGYYDFIVFYARFNRNGANGTYYINYNQTWNSSSKKWADAIYVYYYPKGTINQFNYWDMQNRAFYFRGYGIMAGSDDCYSGQNNPCYGSYISGSGFDVIPLSKRDRNDNVTWLYDDAWTQNNGINIVDYANISPKFMTYTISLDLVSNNPSSYLSSEWSGRESELSSKASAALNGQFFFYPEMDESYIYPITNNTNYSPDYTGFLAYYSSVPIINSSSNKYYAIGSRLISPGQEIPTYAGSLGYQFSNFHSYTDIMDYFDTNDYRQVCSTTQSLIFSSDELNTTYDVIVPENWLYNDNFVEYNFYVYNQSSNTNTEFIGQGASSSANSGNTFYLTPEYLSNNNLPDFLEGMTRVVLDSSGDTFLLVSRSDNNKLYDPNHLTSEQHMWNHYASEIDPVTGLPREDSLNLSSSDISMTSQGGWCVYVKGNIYATSLNTSNASNYYSNSDNPDSCSLKDISFSGQIMTSNGIVNINYSHPYCITDDSVWSYGSNFLDSNSNTFTFISSLFSYFLDNVNSSIVVFLLISLIILIFIKLLGFYNGGGK